MKKALIVIDMQKAFFANNALENQKAKLVKACNDLIKSAVECSCPVFYLYTKHEKNKASWTLNMLDDNKGYLFMNQPDSQPVKGLISAENSVDIYKTRDSGFWKTNLLTKLREKNIDTAVIAGVSTHSCVAMTAADAYAANIKVELATDAIASHKPQLHQITLEMLADEYRMKHITSESVSWR